MNFTTKPPRALRNKNFKKLPTAKYCFEKRETVIFDNFQKVRLCVLHASVAMNFSGFVKEPALILRR